MKFNPEQLSTIEEAREIRDMVNAHGIGGGIAEEDSANDYHNSKSGIYLDPWVDPDGTMPEPREGEARAFLFRFNPTLEGFQPGGNNIGLIRSIAERHTAPAERGADPNPLNWDYALGRLEGEVEIQIAAFKASL